MYLENPSSSPQRRLRISIVTETYPPEINGVAFTIARWIQNLHQRHHSVQLIRVRQDHHDEQGIADPPETVRLPGFRIPGYPQVQAGWPAGRIVLAQWRAAPPDLVHIVTEGPLGYSALRAAQQLQIPLSTSFHTNFQQYSQHYSLGWLQTPITRYLRHFHNQALQTLVPTEELAHQLTALGFQRTQILARGIDTVLFSPQRRNPALRQQWGIGSQTLAALYVGRLAVEKNLELAVAAFQAIRQQRPDARLILVGDGPMTARLRARYPHFVYCGMRQGEDLAAHYASADLFLFPSLTETFGNVVLEAMSSGLTVVAFDYAAAHAHLTSGHNGLLAPFGDAEAFIAAAARAATPTVLAKMGPAARHAMARLDSKLLYDRLESLFLNAARRQPLCQIVSPTL